ncbi:glycogen synthase [Desulfosediminicola ganghwensis]|uniref:glycogen synthase n=1 Tax=Desulfosediminicola ganghwensis TaxID=2569540 RepID=UPI001E63B54A|nr:glycogen/starch synthase [Desulfosediminicola ganghwensis]
MEKIPALNGGGIISNIWMISREYNDLAGAGGVKDVVFQLSESLIKEDSCRVSIVLPGYGFINPEQAGFKPIYRRGKRQDRLRFGVDMNYGLEERRESCMVWFKKEKAVTLYLIEADRFSEKFDVYTYTDEEAAREAWKKTGTGHYDYFAMNVLLQKAALELMVCLDEKPDVIHCHDGHTALIPALIYECQGWRCFFKDTGCLVTIHNAGVGYHQEVADLPFAHGITGLPWSVIGENRLSGKFDPLLTAGSYAVLNTVSSNYAKELMESEEDARTDWLGHALAARGYTIEGVTNGIQPESFNPLKAKELGLAASYDPSSEEDELAGKRQCKERLLRTLAEKELPAGLELFGEIAVKPDDPLFTFIGRLSEQKGIDHFLVAIENLFSEYEDCQAVILGSGSEYLDAAIRSLSLKKELAGRLCFVRGFSLELANHIYAGGDFFVIPSRYEPCGLTDYMAQLFGAVPVVHHVGGLVKVVDNETGIAYRGDSADELYGALVRAQELYLQPDKMRKMQRMAVRKIREEYTWDVVKKKYLELYRQAMLRREKAS